MANLFLTSNNVRAIVRACDLSPGFAARTIEAGRRESDYFYKGAPRMQNKLDTTRKTNLRWGVVLTALYRISRAATLEELIKITELEEQEVTTYLEFLRGQGWAARLADGPEWVCTPAARTVMESMDRSKALEQ
jgi:hypothetical protein